MRRGAAKLWRGQAAVRCCADRADKAAPGAHACSAARPRQGRACGARQVHDLRGALLLQGARAARGPAHRDALPAHGRDGGGPLLRGAPPRARPAQPAVGVRRSDPASRQPRKPGRAPTRRIEAGRRAQDPAQRWIRAGMLPAAPQDALMLAHGWPGVTGGPCMLLHCCRRVAGRRALAGARGAEGRRRRAGPVAGDAQDRLAHQDALRGQPRGRLQRQRPRRRPQEHRRLHQAPRRGSPARVSAPPVPCRRSGCSAGKCSAVPQRVAGQPGRWPALTKRHVCVPNPIIMGVPA